MQADLLIVGGELTGLSTAIASRSPALARTALFALVFFAVCHSLPAQETTVTLDPAATNIEITLPATLHTVHGMFQLKSGEIHFDPSTGKAGGMIIVDATSGNTSNASRDKKMHSEILESAKFPEIVFTPNRVIGPLNDVLSGKGTAQLQVLGVFRLHGQDHDLTLTLSVTLIAGDPSGKPGRIHARGDFAVPYIQWGLKNPGTFVLRVADSINVAIDATGELASSVQR